MHLHLGTAAYLVRLIRLTPDWPAIARYKLRGSGSPRRIRLRDGSVLHQGPLDDAVLMLHEVYVEQFYRPEPPPPEATLVDLGANIGAVTVYWQFRSPTPVRVHAYEPNPATCAMLTRNVEANRLGERVVVHEEAVGRGRGELALWIDGPSHEATGYRDAPPQPTSRRITVPVVGLDDVWERAGHAPIWLLKVDTEGAEVDILEGASPEALDAVRHAIVECHDDILPGASDRCRDALVGAGFEITAEQAFPWDERLIHARRPPDAGARARAAAP